MRTKRAVRRLALRLLPLCKQSAEIRTNSLSQPRLALPLLICTTLVASCQEGALSRRTVSKKYGFSLEQPVGWHAAVGADTDLPLFANFPWSRLQGQAILPSGGATIHILAEDELTGRHQDYTLDDDQNSTSGVRRETPFRSVRWICRLRRKSLGLLLSASMKPRIARRNRGNTI